MKRNLVLLFLSTFLFNAIYAQVPAIGGGEIHGNFQVDAQYFIKDEKIGTPDVPEKTLFNGFGNLMYANSHFSAGIRYEAYLNPLPGFEDYKGQGIPYKFATYTSELIEITVGNYYEQFGSGLVFRSYEERNLGFDNAMDGLRIKCNPSKGVSLKGIIGTQRLYFQQGTGLVRGVDGEFQINEIIESLSETKLKVALGGSFVSKYEKDEDPLFNLPENVGASAGRININYGKVGILAEYAYKINDPGAVNNMIYKPGEALLITATYSQKGLGIILAAKRIDNMNYRSQRNATLKDLLINYLPPLTKQHAYTLPAMYPYATQPNGEIGVQGQVNYKFKKETALGGKYGTDLTVNFSRANNIDRQKINDTIAMGQRGTLGYKSDFFKIGKELYYQDANIEIEKKINSDLKIKLGYGNMIYNTSIIEGHEEPIVNAHVELFEFSYKLKAKHVIRCEFQALQTKQDEGDWALILAEYSIAPSWFFTIQDMYNYGNPDKERKFHYYTGSITFVKKAHRISASYGKQREGIVCIGGVCRNVPASNGFALTITSSF